jgi:hypothetical protein
MKRNLQIRYHCTFRDLCRHFEYKETSELRHKITHWVLGYDQSSTKFTAKEFNLIIDAMEAWRKGDEKPGPLGKDEQVRRSHYMNVKQLIYKLEALDPTGEGTEANNKYIQAIANDRFSRRPWRDLGAFQLKRLYMTIEARSRK